MGVFNSLFKKEENQDYVVADQPAQSANPTSTPQMTDQPASDSSSVPAYIQQQASQLPQHTAEDIEAAHQAGSGFAAMMGKQDTGSSVSTDPAAPMPSADTTTDANPSMPGSNSDSTSDPAMPPTPSMPDTTSMPTSSVPPTPDAVPGASMPTVTVPDEAPADPTPTVVDPMEKVENTPTVDSLPTEAPTADPASTAENNLASLQSSMGTPSAVDAPAPETPKPVLDQTKVVNLLDSLQNHLDALRSLVGESQETVE